ncbi:MAG: OmpH family outer membrane protein [Phycisphaeraceae bacterium]
MELTRKTVVMLTLGVVIAGAAAVAGGNAVLLSAEPSAVAVVDWGRVFNELDEKQAIDGRFQTQLQELGEENRQRQERVQQLQEELQGPVAQAQDAEAFRTKQAELQQALMEHEVWTNFNQRQIQTDMAMAVDRLYRKMLTAVDEIAADNGYDLVLSFDDEPRFRLDGQQAVMRQLEEQIRNRSVLYASETADLTDQVVQRMNNRFEAGE